MLSLRAAAHTRTIKAVPTLSTSIRRQISRTHGNDSEPDRVKRRSSPHGPSTLIPGWNEALATASEANVKADRDTTMTINEMQQKTVDYVQSHLEVEQTSHCATYARDEVGGPLGNAGVGEFEGVVGKDDLGPDDAQVESNGRVVTRRTTVIREKSGAGQANV